jgi:hypothetical protein
LEVGSTGWRTSVLHPHKVSEEEVMGIAGVGAMECHWVLTTQHVNDVGATVTTGTFGTWEVQEGDVRSGVFIEILSAMKAANGIPDLCVVVFFSLEPNQLVKS